MFSQIKRLGTDTAIYGVSTVFGRLLNFLLVPFYTNVLMPSEYGTVSYAYSLIAFFNIVYALGMESAFFKYASSQELGDEKENFSTPFTAIVLTSIFFSVLLSLNAQSIAGMIQIPVHGEFILYCSAAMLALDAVTNIPFALLRRQRKAKRFAAIKVANIVINVGMNLYLLLGRQMGVKGIFISGVVASGATVVMLLPTIVHNFRPRIHTKLLHELLRYGIPTIPAGVASIIVQVADRPIMMKLTDSATVGIYQANYKLGIFMMLIVSMFEYAWRPFFFSVAKEENAKQIFSRVLTYFVFVALFVFLVLTFFIDDLVKLSIFGRHIIHPNFWSGLYIVPIVLLGYVFLGIATNLSAGLYIEKRTSLTPISTFVAAVVNVAANYFLIPLYGIAGAAWATLLAYFAMAITAYITTHKVYPIRYEWGRVALLAVISFVLTVLFYFVAMHSTIEKLFLLICFPLLLFVFKFFRTEEIEKVKQIFHRQ